MKISIYCLDFEKISNLNPLQYSFIIKNDTAPTIAIQSPDLEFEIDESLKIPIEANIYDDYGVHEIWIEYKIISEDFVDENNIINTIEIKKINSQIEDIYINQLWDINNINLFMGDELHFWICANDKDNISGPNISKSDKIIGISNRLVFSCFSSLF